MTLIRISPDGSEVLHLYDDKVVQITSKTSDIKVTRASDIFFDNKDKVWRIKFRHTNAILALSFETRAEALEYEQLVLEQDMRCLFV